jgi:hypothetical protein
MGMAGTPGTGARPRTSGNGRPSDSAGSAAHAERPRKCIDPCMASPFRAALVAILHRPFYNRLAITSRRRDVSGRDALMSGVSEASAMALGRELDPSAGPLELSVPSCAAGGWRPGSARSSKAALSFDRLRAEALPRGASRDLIGKVAQEQLITTQTAPYGARAVTAAAMAARASRSRAIWPASSLCGTPRTAAAQCWHSPLKSGRHSPLACEKDNSTFPEPCRRAWLSTLGSRS